MRLLTRSSFSAILRCSRSVSTEHWEFCNCSSKSTTFRHGCIQECIRWSGHTSALVVGFHCQFMVKIATLIDALMPFATWCHHLAKDTTKHQRGLRLKFLCKAPIHLGWQLCMVERSLHPSTEAMPTPFKAFDWRESSIHMPCKELALFSLHAENLLIVCICVLHVQKNC